MSGKEKSLTILYNDLIKKVATDYFYQKINMDNRINCYTCILCKHITKTIDIDRGVTPFIIICSDCGNNAVSNFYKDKLPDKTPTIEWYRPQLTEFLDMDNDMQNYVLNGGLIMRSKQQQPQDYCKQRKVVHLFLADVPVVFNIFKAAQKGINNQDMYCIIMEEPDTTGYLKTVDETRLRALLPDKYITEVFDMLGEIDNG